MTDVAYLALWVKDTPIVRADLAYLDYPVGAGNVVMCRSGFGDGYYPTYVGLDAQGDVGCFVTDFGPLHDDEEDE